MVETFGGKIKNLRKSRNITQLEFSRILNIERSNIAHYESGKRYPPIETLIKIADFFSVSIDSLIRTRNVGLKDTHEIDSSEISELKAEIIQLMDMNLRLTENLQEIQHEMKLLKKYNNQLMLHNRFLEKSLKKKH